MPVTTVISGGQTGVDRAGFDAALAHGLEIGGAAPDGFWAEDGRIPDRYRVNMHAIPGTRDSTVAARTRRNIEDADGTVVFTIGAPDGGTRLTLRVLEEAGGGHRWRRVDGRDMGSDRQVADTAASLAGWIAEHEIAILNVAGPRESDAPALAATVLAVLDGAFRRLETPPADPA